ncbi:MAG: WYL domain-containing protein [Ktedonobacterales bacterium]|nr:WYL domain-containing protein [Ktedonobacterales bacterium]
MRGDRLLSILLLLQAHRRMTARALAERMEVSERTIYRDVEALGRAGVPVYTERGPNGGCGLIDNYRTNLTGMTEMEIRTLSMAGASKQLADLGLDKALDGALIKMLAAMPTAFARDAERSRQRFHLDSAAWSQSNEEVPHLRDIQTALWEDRELCIRYRRDDGKLVERVVHPLGLVAKGSIWYCIADAEGQRRTYRVSRMQAAEVLATNFTRPPDFDLPSHWATSCAEFKAKIPRHAVRVRISPRGFRHLPSGLTTEWPATGGPEWHEMTLTFEAWDEARNALMSLGAEVEVLEPVELRQSIQEMAAEIIAFYASKQRADAEDATTLVPQLA